MAVSDVLPQDGCQSNVKLHPYLITLVRWCVSCLWSTATVFLHRLVTSPLPPITAGKVSSRSLPRLRQAGTDHLHPEPRVECVVLHAPDTRTHCLDVIFVHGLYGSLGNTWRQGEWRTKYKLDPTKVPLRNHSSDPCSCSNKPRPYPQETYSYDNVSLKELNGCLQKILPNENSLITEQFYNNTLLREVDSYDTQGQFVSELFRNDCDTNCDGKCSSTNEECRCKADKARCEVGCGCICDECYSHCWPRDWIKEDFPGARVISINYTSDPYLWRPLWVKGNKRLRLHERAEQMIEQLLELEVGRRPIVWVGHSKGGLFIKQIYCEAYEAHLKMDKSVTKKQNRINNNSKDQCDRQYNKTINNNIDNKFDIYNDETHTIDNDHNCNSLLNNFIKKHKSAGCTTHGETQLRSIDEMNELRNNNNSGNNKFVEEASVNKDLDMNYNMQHDDTEMFQMFGCTHNDGVLDTASEMDVDLRIREDGDVQDEVVMDDSEDLSSNIEEDSRLPSRASLWSNSSGFMFYSVPHRGSPLADIKTPITSRSVELLEIAKDCPLVLELQSRWLLAAAPARPLVRSLVETCRTLMSVLWLTIVSEHSADAGVGVLHGVSVDHREICKPSSRRCLLYTELTQLIQQALNKCRCH